MSGKYFQVHYGAVNRGGKKKAMNQREKELCSHSEEETRRLGEIIGKNLVRGDLVALIGDLGSGKTCLTKGLAKSLGVSDEYEITSPTFTIINEYPGRFPLWHVDAYRLENSREMMDAGFEDFCNGGGVVVIEAVFGWPGIGSPAPRRPALGALRKKLAEIQLQLIGEQTLEIKASA